jgi:hypothetical protein
MGRAKYRQRWKKIAEPPSHIKKKNAGKEKGIKAEFFGMKV